MTIPILLALAGSFLGWANPLFHFPPAVLGLPLALAWIAFRSHNGRAAFRSGWLAGALSSAACLYWVALPPHDFGGLPWILAAPCPMLMGSIMGLYYGLFTWGLRQAARVMDGPPLCLFAALAWTGQEMVQNMLFTGFPWLTLSAAFAPWPFMIQGAAVVGAYGMSGLFAALAVAAKRMVHAPLCRYVAGVLVLGLAACGWWGLDRSLPAPDIPVALVQGNIDQSLKWDKAYQDGTVDKYIALSRRAVQDSGATLVVWPETALPFYFQEPVPLAARVSALAREGRFGLLAGSPAFRHDLKTNSTALFNRAWLLDETGKVSDWYDKEHLVPFGEYVPLQSWFPWLPVSKLVEGVGEFLPGTRTRPLRLDRLALGVLICYEAIFPELAQARVDAGANVLVSISNDAWFGRSSAPAQHLALSTLRAVEQSRWLLRGTNTGISALIAPTGQVTARTGLFEDAAITGRVAAIKELTPFHWSFSLWGWLVAVGLAAFSLRIWLGIKRRWIPRLDEEPDEEV